MKLDTSGWTRPWRRVRSLIFGVLSVWAVVSGPVPPAWHGPGLAVGVLTAVAVAAWLAIDYAERNLTVIATCSLGLIACGLAIFAIGPNPVGLMYAIGGLIRTVTSLDLRWSVPVTAGSLLVFIAIELAARENWWLVGAGVGAAVLITMSGTIRRQALLRSEQTELLLAETERARSEQARAAAYAERARIAREIHDVLAHTLTALSVQLESIDALLDRDRTEQAREAVARAQTLMREGLAETRRAISALRTDPIPLPQLLRTLAASYQADTGAEARVVIGGDERPLGAEAGLTLFRTAQEAITNVRKHAPRATVELGLEYGADKVTLSITNVDGGPPQQSAFDRVGGYGLAGLRERAELAGGSFSAHPIDHGWRVDVMIPT